MNLDELEQAAAEMSLDELEQWAAEVQSLRCAAHFAAARVAAIAVRKGQGGLETISPYFHWSRQNVNRMALLAELPEDVAWPDAPLGLYWAAAQAFEGPELEERLREALRDDWSVTKARQEWGLTEPKEKEDPVLECEAATAWDDSGPIFLPVDWPPGFHLPARVRLKVWKMRRNG